jgi:chromate reductase
MPAMTNPTLAVVVGSNRRESINRKLAEGIAKLAAGRFDVRFIKIDDLPMYNPDLESETPPEVLRFKQEVKEADALLILTPEHNRDISTVLKNAIDWGSRPYGQSAWGGKPAFVTGTTPGAIGTAMAQHNLRTMLNFLGVYTIPAEAYITWKPGLVDDNGTITNEDTAKFLKGFVDKLADLTERFSPAQQKSAA